MRRFSFRFAKVLAVFLGLISARLFAQAAGTQEGMASWYGDPFHGRITASGEIFDKTQFTCAHLTLEFGTRLLVTNLYNDRQVIVRVTDRGPFVKDRIIDLSEAAGESLGMISGGVAKVRLEVVSKASKPGPVAQGSRPDAPETNAIPDTVSLPPPGPATASIQVASFASKDYAERAAAKLRASGFKPVIETVPDPRSPLSPALHRVFLYGIRERDIDATKIRLSDLGFREVVVRKESRLPS